MSSLGNALAFALPLLAAATGGGGSAAATSQTASSSATSNFLSAGAKAFLGAQDMKPGGKPFMKAAPTAARPRSVSELTQGRPVGTVTPGRPVDPVQFQMPLYRSALENLQKNVRNAEVRNMLDRYGYVQPTKAVGQSEKVRMTEVNV